MRKLRIPIGLGFALTFFLCVFILRTPAQAAAPTGLLVKDGQKVVFFGDDMTETGAKIAGGYVKLVESGLGTLGVKIVTIPAGHTGTSRELLARLDRDVLSQKPDWVVFSSGFSDAWNHGLALELYKKNVTSIVNQLQAAGAKVMILTPLPVEPFNNGANPGFAEEAVFLQQLAKEKNLPLADLNAAFMAELKAQPPGSGRDVLTIKGNQPNPTGYELIAKTVLQAWGASPAQLAQVEQVWLDTPGNATVTAFSVIGLHHTIVSLKEYADLKKVALARKMPVFDLINEVYLESILEALKARGDFNNTNQDVISNEVEPIFDRKIADLIKNAPAA